MQQLGVATNVSKTIIALLDGQGPPAMRPQYRGEDLPIKLDGIRSLGAPVGARTAGSPPGSRTPEGARFTTVFFDGVIAKAQERVTAIRSLLALNHPGAVMQLLAPCIAPGFSHLSRSHPYTPLLVNAARRFDGVIVAGVLETLRHNNNVMGNTLEVVM